MPATAPYTPGPITWIAVVALAFFAGWLAAVMGLPL